MATGGGYVEGKARAGDVPGSAIVGGGAVPDQSQVRFRASDLEAPATPALPIAAPGAPTTLGLAEALRGSRALLLWNLVPQPPPPGHIHPSVFTDYAWRWQKHEAAPNPAIGGSPYMTVDTSGLKIVQQPIPSGGGSYNGFNVPVLAVANSSSGTQGGPLVDPAATPIYTVAVSWHSDVVTVDGTPPPAFSTSPSMPGTPRLTIQPIIGNFYTNGPWILYCEWTGSWIGGPGAWTFVTSARLVLSWGGSGGPTTIVAINGKTGGTDYVEIDNVAKTILLYGGTSSGSPPGSGDGTPISTGSQGAGGWPGDFNGHAEVFGEGNMGAYYWGSYRQLNGHLFGVGVMPLSAADTVALVSERSLVPGTGPIVPRLKFRAGDHPSASLSAQLSEYTHYWPLDDPSPGPMYDLLDGVRLSVVNPTLATFQADGITNPLAPTHTKGIHLGRHGIGSSATSAYLTWAGAGPTPFLGTGAVGHDLTIGCWIKWEGPPNFANAREIIRSSGVPFGFVSEPAIQVTIWPFAEPFGVEFTTWDSVGGAFKTLRTTTFDWPADYLLDFGDPTLPYDVPIPYKGPVWAYLTVVLRTVAGHMTQEIWMDGVLIAQQAGADGGWGSNVWLVYVGRGLANATMQHLTVWPFALDPSAISGAGVA